MPLQFEVFDAESGMFIYPGQTYGALVDQLDELLDDHQSGRLGDKPYLAGLVRLQTAAPDLLDAHAHIAIHWHEAGKPKKALDAALAGLSIANRHIPEGFDGRIEWGHIENRPYLRNMQIALLSYMRLKRHKDAAKVIELMLARNPNDNQGVRFLLGSELMRAGDLERARAVFEGDTDGYPPYFYDLALCNMFQGDWVRAATALRRGFAANSYIAELLGGNSDPATLSIWHSSNLAAPGTACEYFDMCGSFWLTEPDSFPFTRWLFNHPMILAERAEVMTCQEALLWERDVAARRALGERERAFVEGISDNLSAAIVVKRKDRDGNVVWPWAVRL